MIIPTHCMTCGRVIGHLWELYSKYTKENNALLAAAKDSNLSLDPEHTDKKARGKAMDQIKLEKVCCRTSMLSHIDLTSRLRNRYQDN